MNKEPAKNQSKKIYSTYNSLAMSGIPDDLIIKHLLGLLKTSKQKSNLTFMALLSGFYNNGKIDSISIVELIGLVHQKKKEKISISSTDERKHNGIYYTNYSIAKRIAEDTLSLYKTNPDPLKLTFLEPCSGTGIFALAYLDTIFGINKKYLTKAQKILNNMYFADIDREAILLLTDVIPAYLKSKYRVKVKVPKDNIFIGDALFETKNNFIRKNDLKEVFKIREGFDIVLTNPPYKLLKANSNKYNGGTDNYKQQINQILNYIRKNKVYKYNTGTLNLYMLFLEEILENYTKSDSKVGLLIPTTLLSDKQGFQLRNRILDKYSLSTVYTIPERNEFFLDITQAFCFFSLDKECSSKNINLKTNINDIDKLNQASITIKQDWINKISSLKEIVPTDNMGWRILSKIHRHTKLKEIPSITNLRGELDLTINKPFITLNKTSYHLLKGDGINEYVFVRGNLYVKDEFVDTLNGKRRYLLSDRLVCQQISNLNSQKRLKFSKVPQKIVLGNSCNFIVINNNSLFNEDNVSLDYLLGVMNSLLLNWRFQKTSSNNHIGNYELDELPLAIPNVKQKHLVEELTTNLILNPNNINYKARLNKVVFDIYGLTTEEAKYILRNHGDSEVASITEDMLYQK